VRLICGFLLWSSFPIFPTIIPEPLTYCSAKCFLGCVSVQKVSRICPGVTAGNASRIAASDCLEIFAAWSGRIDFIIRANRRKCQNWAAMFRAKIQNASIAQSLAGILGQGRIRRICVTEGVLSDIRKRRQIGCSDRDSPPVPAGSTCRIAGMLLKTTGHNSAVFC